MRGPIPFWFKNMWMKEEGFKDLVKSCCQGLRFRGSSSFILVEKLMALRPLTETGIRKYLERWKKIRNLLCLEWFFGMSLRARDLYLWVRWKIA